MQSEGQVRIGKKAFLTSVIILFSLMVLAGLLTMLIPAGSYDRIQVEGRETVDPDSFHTTEKTAYPVWRWFTAPLEVLGGSDSLVLIIIILFLFFIGGSVNILNESKVFNAILGKVVHRFRNKKYLLLAVITFVFMSFGAFLGLFEEVVPMVPIMVFLSYAMGWDSLVGLGMVILASGFGFAAAVSNPFTIGVAQSLADLPLFSGFLFRLLIFIVIYLFMFLFLRSYARRIEKTPELSPVYAQEQDLRLINKNGYERYDNNKGLNRAIGWFSGAIALLVLVLISGAFIEGLSDYSLPLVGLVFLIGGFGAGILSGLRFTKTFKIFLNGCIGIAPAVLLILMAASIKHIITHAGVMDTILHSAAGMIKEANPIIAVAIVYLLVLVMEFFIGSGSAKAFLIMPIVIPLADIIGVNRQIMVLAFQFGDGFSNLLYPTNPVLLISLGLTVVSYTKWFKWIFKLQAVVFLITLALLELALVLNVGPF